MALTLLGQDDLVFRASSKFIAVDVQALSGQQTISGLTLEDFRVWDNGQAQTISSFGAEDQELDVILMLDASQSTGSIQENIKASASAALALLRPRDRVGLVVFWDEPYVAIPLTSDRQTVLARLDSLPPGRGGTELNATVLATAKYLRQNARTGARRAIVMMSDNRGYQGVSDEAVRNELWANNVVFNLLLFRGAPSRGRADVREFAKATGGEVLPFRPQGVPLAELFQRLRQRYYFLYPAPESAPGTVHNIRVELSDDARRRFRNARLRSRTGYLADGANP